MRILVALALAFFSVSAVAQTPGADRTYPDKWVPLLRKLPIEQVNRMQATANQFCAKLDAETVRDLYGDVSRCTLSQSSAIQTVDTSLWFLDMEEPTKYRPGQIKQCWGLYRALGGLDVENLANCFEKVEHFEAGQRAAAEQPASAGLSGSSYCEKVAQAGGGSYVILEECLKMEGAAKRRLGR